MNAEIKKTILKYVCAIMQMSQNNAYTEGQWRKHGANINCEHTIDYNLRILSYKLRALQQLSCFNVSCLCSL